MEPVTDTAGSTIAETLQGLISPGSTVYASGAAVASSLSTIESGDATSSDSTQTFQMSASATLSVPPPVAILAPVDQRAPVQQGAVGGGEAGGLVASSAVVVSSRPQPAVCQLVQPSPQGLVAGQEGVMTPAGAAVYGSGGQMMTTESAAIQSQVIAANLCILVN